MKKTAIVLFCLACTAILGFQETKIKVVTDTADIHIEAHRSSTVIETVKKGTVLTLFETGRQQKAWYYISYYSEEKWATITGFIEAVKVEPVGGPPSKMEKAETEVEAAVQEETAVKAEAEVAEAEEAAAVEAKAEEVAAGVENVKGEDVQPAAGRVVRVSGEARVSGGEALLRAAADEEARMLALMPAGTALELTGKKGDWYRVKFLQEDGSVSVGYVHQAMISFFPEAKAEQAQPPEEEIKDPETKETVVEISPPVKESEQVDIPKEEEPPATPEVQEHPVVEARTAGLGLGIRGGYALPSESGYEGSLAVGFSLAYCITPNLEIEAGGLFYESQVEGQPEGLSRGKLRVQPLFLSVKGRYPLGKRFAPYAVAGVGYFFNTFKLCDSIRGDWEPLGFEVKEEVENSFGFQVGAGCEYYLLPNLAVSLDARYLLSRGKGSWSFVDMETGMEVSENFEDLNLNTLVLGLGVRFYFSIF